MSASERHAFNRMKRKSVVLVAVAVILVVAVAVCELKA